MRHVLVAIVMIGCDSGARGGDDDARNDGGQLLRCAALEDELRQVIATRGTCETDADCELVAGPQGFACDGEAYMIDCGGVAIERNAPGVARATELKRTYFDTGCDEGRPGAFDCAPRLLRCDDDHRCASTQRSCLPPPPDAGIDATAG